MYDRFYRLQFAYSRSITILIDSKNLFLSLEVLSFMVAVVAIAMFVKYQVIMGGVGATEGISSVAMQQAGLGVILTVLLIATPPIAAMFFSGTLANFSAYSQFGQGQARDNAGNPVGSGGRYEAPTERRSDDAGSLSAAQSRTAAQSRQLG